VALDVYKDWLGIPDGPRPPDYYTLLRLVQFEDDNDKIRRHYKKLNAHVRKYATGQYAVPSQELLNELAKAMLCLTDPARKREFDEKTGRKFEPATSTTGHPLMENVLVDQGHLNKEHIKDARAFADLRGLSMRDAIVQMKLADAQTASRAFAIELGFSYVDLEDMMPDDSVLDKVPRALVKRNSILPLFIDNDVLLVACAEEPTHMLEDELRLRFGVPIRQVIATPLAINQAIAKYYAAGMRDETAQKPADAATTQKTTKLPKNLNRKPRKRTTQLTSEEQQQGKLLGIVIICWTTIASILIDQFLLKPLFFQNWSFVTLTTLILPLLAVWYVVRVYWKS